MLGLQQRRVLSNVIQKQKPINFAFLSRVTTISASADLATFVRKMGGLIPFPIMVVRKLERGFVKKKSDYVQKFWA